MISRRLIAFAHDIVALVLCWFCAYWLRFNLDVPSGYFRGVFQVLLLLIAVHAPAYWLVGLYRGIWRFASLMDLRRIIVAVSVAATVMAAAVTMLRIPMIPRSMLVLHPILLIMAMGGSRLSGLEGS